ncbi:hypothetical protein [Streptomyces rubellomurinus]|nr:hypothetical protein [Streptomyces rubellomurinus]
MVLVAQVTQFPPKSDTYRLETPVELIDLENPGTIALPGTGGAGQH